MDHDPIDKPLSTIQFHQNKSLKQIFLVKSSQIHFDTYSSISIKNNVDRVLEPNLFSLAADSLR